MKIITQNKKALHDYHILESIEAGIVLTGDEVKSIRAGHVSLTGSFAVFKDHELTLVNCHITPYEKAYIKEEDQAVRSRILLLHRNQLRRLIGDVSRKGITIVPLKLYLNDRNYVKVELGIAKHKQAADKRQALKERDLKREASRALKQY